MGAVGARRSAGTTRVILQQTTPQPQQQNIQQQVPTPQNTPVTPGALTKISSMDDASLAALINSAKGIQMPNMLADVHDPTQEFVFAAGLNEKPMVLDSQAFDQFMKDNGIPQREILSRSTSSISYRNQDGTDIKLSADQVNDLFRYSRLTYIGGKHGGQAYGAGAYFDMNGGSSTGYGGTTMNAVLNPKTAKIIELSKLKTRAAKYAQSHPQVATAIHSLTGNYSPTSTDNASIYALLMGYNVIKSSHSYHNIIDRSALVVKK